MGTNNNYKFIHFLSIVNKNRIKLSKSIFINIIKKNGKILSH